MNNLYRNFLIFAIAAVAALFSFLQFSSHKTEEVKFQKVRSSSSPKASVEMKKARDDYFFNMLRDPSTNKIPPAIRQKELEFAKIINKKNTFLQKTSAFTWSEAGPNNVGGRTRALAVDINNSNIIIAGGASGGIWKSTDKGTTWTLKSTNSTVLSVSSIVQDPRPGSTNTWYYSSGEFRHNLAGTVGSSFTGNGIYKSTDNGETWNVLASTFSPNPASWESDFDYVLRVAVSPVNGNIFTACNGIGIFRSTDGGDSFTKVLGEVNEHIYSDVAVASNGTVLAVLSAGFQGTTPAQSPGLYKTTNDGANWTNITPGSYPSTSSRSVIAIAPSNPNTAYLLTHTGVIVDNKEDNKFYKVNISGGTSEDRTNNLPDFTSLGGVASTVGYVTTQNGYDMIVAVKPDNENFVLIGGSSLFLSTDGFATKPLENKTAWIGGYHPQSFGYPNFHPDVHSFAFDPADPNKMWWGHDGGLSYTSDITNTSYQTYFPWEKKNNGYNVTQFYHISISKNSGDNRIMGGTQDNGTPYLTFNGSIADQIDDVSSGDGSFSYFGENYAYTSSQSGNVNRMKYDLQGNPSWNSGWSNITPTGASNQFFINPFVVDPSDENVMYYPAGNVLWRNNQLGSIPDFQNGTAAGWTRLDNLTVPGGYGIYALNVSTTPASILYYAAFNPQDEPKIYKLTGSAAAADGEVEISVPGAAAGAYINDIAVNPDDGNEIIVVMSNYNITGLYHSANGGQNYTAIEGNLEGTQQNPGPSLRAATILPKAGGKTYFVATSIGLFSTDLLNGASTVWTQEGQNVLGNVIVSSVTSRKSDGRVVAGTHGRGAFVGNESGGGSAVLNLNTNQLNIEVYPELTRSTSFRISNSGGSQLSFSISASGGDANIKELVYRNLPKSTLLLSNKMKSSLTAEYQNKLKIEKIYSPLYSKPYGPSAIEELILDDGNSSPAGFLGAGGGVYFYSANSFQMDKDFALQKVKYFMKTEGQNTNPIRLVVTSADNILFDTTISSESSPPEGKWYEFGFPQYILNSLQFQNGNSFQLVVITLNTVLTFPSGVDDNALKPNNSFWAYYDPVFAYFTGWVNLNSIYPNGAFLIRAIGNSDGGGGTNQAPTANAQVSPNPAQINQSVSFIGSGSSDPDGQITNYLWEFGDGATSTEANAIHSYSAAGQFTYKLTVTDNNGSTNQATNQITITEIGGSTDRITVSPANGNIASGGFQEITVTYNSQGLAEGNYQGQLNISSNGGNSVIPINIFISTTVDVEDKTDVYSYKLSQNYPNPFNPSTVIDFQVPLTGLVTIKVYDIRGSEVATLLNEEKGSGKYRVTFNAAGLASGLYFYRITSNNFSETKKMMLLK